MRLTFALPALLVACSGADPTPEFTQRQNQNKCDMEGTWATFVEVGVGWESGTIRPGAGTTKQWILSRRHLVSGGAIDEARACGIGAKGVPLGSPWFSTIDLPEVGLPSEWTGVTFSPELFDSGRLAEIQVPSRITSKNPSAPVIGDGFATDPVPFQFGIDGFGQDVPWPTVAEALPHMVDHDGDGLPGLTGAPFQGQVPGEADGVVFKDPRLDLTGTPARTSGLHMAIRTRAGLRGTLVSCDPPRMEGDVIPSTLVIETRSVGCTVAGSGQPCTPDQSNFIDSNLPNFVANGTSRVVIVKVPDDTTCKEVRDLEY